MATTSAVYSGTSNETLTWLCAAEVVDLVRIDRLQHPAQPAAVGEVAVMQGHAGAGEVGVVIEMVDAVGVELAGSAHHAMDLVALGYQELGQVGPILAGDAGNQGALWLTIMCHGLARMVRVFIGRALRARNFRDDARNPRSRRRHTREGRRATG